MIDETKFAAMVKAGRTTAEIADEFGVSSATARRWARECSLSTKKSVFRTVRERAEQMTPGTAVRWLLEMLELLNESMCGERNHEVDSWGVHFTPSERRLMICLVDSKSIATIEALHAALMFNTPGGTEPKLVAVLVCKLRKKLPPEIGAIKNSYGLGYAFVRASK